MTNPGPVVIILKGYPRLSETFIAQELLGLERAGLRLHIASMRHPTDPETHPIHKEIRAPVLYLPEYLYLGPGRVIRGLVHCAQLPGFRRALRMWLSDLCHDFSPNRFRRFGQAAVLASEMPTDTRWLHAHFIHTPSAVARYASLMADLPWSCSAHAKDIWTSPEWELCENLASARWVVTCTRNGHERLANLASERSHVKLAYHGIDLTRFGKNENAPSCRDGSNPLDPVRLLTVGRAVEKKGFEILLEALASLPPDLHWTLIHIGGGALLERLKSKARALGIAQRVTWHGARSQSAVITAYRAADAFVLACRTAANGDRDGMPNVLVEAQSQRLACLSTIVGGVPELICNGETGLLVPPEDAGALADALSRLIRDPELRRQLGAAAERRVRAIFDMGHGLRTLVAMFETSLLEQESRVVAVAAQ